MTSLAVLTGDLARSTRFPPEAAEQAMKVITGAARDVAGWPGGSPARFTRFRGDGWQIVVTPPALALRASLLIIARLRAARDLPATRIAIGLGAAETLGSADLADARGPAFAASGRRLDALPRGARIGVSGPRTSPLRAAIVALLDERSARWSPEQAEAMALALIPGELTQAAIAAGLGISAQAVSQRLAGAGAQAILPVLDAWEASGTEGENPG